MKHGQHGSVVIVGGGITGLTVAHALKTRGYKSVTLLESSSRLGGIIRTIREDGFLIENGPDSFFTAKPYATDLVHELGIEHELIPPASRSFLVYKNGTLCRVPDGFISMAPTAVAPLLASNLFSVGGRLRVLLERFQWRSRPTGDESLRSFFSRRFGSEFSATLAEPLFAGIHAGRGDELSMQALLPQFLDMEASHGSITRAVLARRGTNGPSTGAMFSSLRTGMESLVGRLATSIDNVSVRLNCVATGVTERNDGQWIVSISDSSALEADHVVLTTSAHVAGSLLAKVSPAAAEHLSAISYTSSSIATLAYPTSCIEHPLDATGFIVPRNAGLRMTACTWSASKWAGRAPDGVALFRCFFGCDGDDDDVRRSDNELVELASQELGQAVGAKGKPIGEWIHRWPQTMPQYTLGHLKRMNAIGAQLEDSPGIHLAGSSYRGVGIPDCVFQACQIAEYITKE